MLKTAINITIEPMEPLITKAIGLIESKQPGYLEGAGVKHIIVESTDMGHLGKVQSDKPDTIFISINKIKNIMGGAQTNEESIISQIAMTLIHEVGHLKDKLKGGEGPAEAEEAKMRGQIMPLQSFVTRREERLSKVAAADLAQRVEEANAAQLKGVISQLQTMARGVEDHIVTTDQKIEELDAAPDNLKANSDFNYERRRAALMAHKAKQEAVVTSRLALVDRAKARYLELTGTEYVEESAGGFVSKPKPIDIDVPAKFKKVRQPGEERATAPSTPGKKEVPAPVELPPLPGKVEVTNDDKLETLAKKILIVAVKDVVAGASTARAGELASSVIRYMVGSGPAEFLKGAETYMGKSAEAANEAIATKLNAKINLVDTYMSLLRGELAAFVTGDQADIKEIKTRMKELADTAADHLRNAAADVTNKTFFPSTTREKGTGTMSPAGTDQGTFTVPEKKDVPVSKYRGTPQFSGYPSMGHQPDKPVQRGQTLDPADRGTQRQKFEPGHERGRKKSSFDIPLSVTAADKRDKYVEKMLQKRVIEETPGEAVNVRVPEELRYQVDTPSEDIEQRLQDAKETHKGRDFERYHPEDQKTKLEALEKLIIAKIEHLQFKGAGDAQLNEHAVLLNRIQGELKNIEQHDKQTERHIQQRMTGIPPPKTDMLKKFRPPFGEPTIAPRDPKPPKEPKPKK